MRSHYAATFFSARAQSLPNVSLMSERRSLPANVGTKRNRSDVANGAESNAATTPCAPCTRDRAEKANEAMNTEQCSGPVGSGTNESKELPSVPHIDEWRLVQSSTASPYDAPELGAAILCGRVSGHPLHTDGKVLWTTPVVWLDYGKDPAAKTRSRRYTLGAPLPEFIAFLKGRTDATSLALCSSDATTTRRCYPNGT